MSTPSKDNEIRIIRLYDAPLALVWDAWTDLKQVAQWWGPRGFTITTHSKDLRPGGTWDYTMHGPDGTDWPNFTTYHEVEHQSRLVYDHGASSADAAPLFRVTATFRAIGDKTELDMRMALATAEQAAQSRVFIKSANGNSTWDRLAEYLEKQVSSQEVFVIARSFDAPIEAVFDAWTTPAQLAAWLPPAGFTMTYQHADIRTGGALRFSLNNADFEMHVAQRYLDVRRPDALSYVQSFTDADGNLTRQPGSPNWPEYNLVTVNFFSEGPAHSRVVVRFAVEGDVTADEMAAFTAERTGMMMGWSGSFDALDELLQVAAATR